jgi:hypothetical protein
MNLHSENNSWAKAREISAVWARLPATGWKVFAFMLPVAVYLHFTLSALLAHGELPMLVSLIAHGRLAYVLLPALAPALAYAAPRLRESVALDPRRLIWLLHSLLLAYALLAVLITWLVSFFH